MIRSVLFLTLTLTLGTGESATLLCQTVCDRVAPAEEADSCRHNQSAAELTVTNDVDCAGVGLPTTAVIRDETHQAASTVPNEAATAVSVSNEPPAATFERAAAAAASCLTAGNRPRTVALRI